METTIPTKLCAWLQTAPGFAANVKTLTVEHTGAAPGQAGLYPQGVQVLARTENLLGEVRARCRCTLVLRLVLGAAMAQNANFLLALQHWVNAESAAGRAPVFGDADAPRETLRATAGKLAARSDEGSATYTLLLAADYTVKTTLNGEEEELKFEN